MHNWNEVDYFLGRSIMSKETTQPIRIGACYIRVSTDDQLELSPESQKDELCKYAKNNNIVIPEEYIFIEDKGRSGKRSVNRPEFQNMIGLAKSSDHPFDIILVWKYSRFARNQEESILYKSLLKKNKVDVISITEPLIDGPFGELIERIIEWMDEYYSIRLAGDVIRGMTKKALLGGYQAAAPFGYSIPNGVLIPNKDAVIIKQIFDMYISGQGFFNIAQKLNEMQLTTYRGGKFEHRTVRYIIQNPIYKGYIRWNNNGKTDLRNHNNATSDMIITKGKHEPIISEELWNMANDKLQRDYHRPYSKPSTKMSHWLSGLLFCDSCMSVMVSGGSSGGFQCNAYAKGKCTVSHYISFKKIEQAVIKAICELSDDYNLSYEVIPSVGAFDDMRLSEAALKKLEQKETRIKDAYINGIDTLEEYKENKSRIEAERIRLTERIVSIKDNSDSDQVKFEMMNRLKNLYSIITSGVETSIKNTAIKSVVKRIVYSRSTENIEVFLYYS
jgi:DNA invertase Pin-like site-specific DNA recombinase